MILSGLDWVILLTVLSVFLGLGVYFTHKGGQTIQQYLLGDKNLPWYIAGTAMAASTFALDAPLLVTELVTRYGISGNWLWWNALIGGMMTTFFFAKLWKRSDVLTDLEFIELRYSGFSARLLRTLRGIYFGAFLPVLMLAMVNLAMISFLEVFFGLERASAHFWMAVCMGIAAVYTVLSGFKGVVMTGVLQCILALLGALLLAFFVLQSDVLQGIEVLRNHTPAESLHFFPTILTERPDTSGMSLSLGIGSFLAMVSFQWWFSGYPGTEPGGGGFVVQRILSTQNEQDALYSTFFFQLLHYCIRPWPWILVALATLSLYPDLGVTEKRLGYFMALRDFLPVGLRGLLLATCIGAYLSAVSTYLNWGIGYLVHDVYQRNLKPTASQKHLVSLARLMTLLLTGLALGVSTQLTGFVAVWTFLIECSAGLGVVLILRWYWWRINAWSEIVATITPFLAYGLARGYLVYYDPAWGLSLFEDPRSFMFICTITTLAWLCATYLSPATHSETLKKFYLKVQPPGNWDPVKHTLDMSRVHHSVRWLFLAWLSAVVFAYALLFLIGYVIFSDWNAALISIGLIVLSFFGLRTALRQTKSR